MGTATPSATLVVKQIFDVGQVVAVRFSPEASASFLPSDIINDCTVEVHVHGRRVCALVANGKFIGGDVRDFFSRDSIQRYVVDYGRTDVRHRIPQRLPG